MLHFIGISKNRMLCQTELVEVDLDCIFYKRCFDKLNMTKFLEMPLFQLWILMVTILITQGFLLKIFLKCFCKIHSRLVGQTN